MRRSNMRTLARTTTAAVLLGLWTAESAAEVFACEGDDGVMSYQDQPCPAPNPDADPEPENKAVSQTQASAAPAKAVAVDAELVAACKKRYRDAIDRQYAELASDDASDKLEEDRDQARALSQQRSRCEHGGTNSTSGDQ